MLGYGLVDHGESNRREHETLKNNWIYIGCVLPVRCWREPDEQCLSGRQKRFVKRAEKYWGLVSISLKTS